jgi:acetyltransferase-like isoleucine patch superfamily enzyme
VIGDQTSIGAFVEIQSGASGLQQRHDLKLEPTPVCRRASIGSRLRGLTIGENAMIGTRDTSAAAY